MAATADWPATLRRPEARLMPSFVMALREGYHQDTTRPETSEEIEAIAADPAGFLRGLLGPKDPFVTLPDGGKAPRVPETLLWLVRDEVFIGNVRIRHHLTPALEKFAGHVGYAIRPSERGRGYGKSILALALTYARETLGLERLLLTCDDDNLASRRVIETNGGTLIDLGAHPFAPGRRLRRYHLDTSRDEA